MESKKLMIYIKKNSEANVWQTWVLAFGHHRYSLFDVLTVMY